MQDHRGIGKRKHEAGRHGGLPLHFRFFDRSRGYLVERKEIVYGANPEGCLEAKVFNRAAMREN